MTHPPNFSTLLFTYQSVLGQDHGKQKLPRHNTIRSSVVLTWLDIIWVAPCRSSEKTNTPHFLSKNFKKNDTKLLVCHQRPCAIRPIFWRNHWFTDSFNKISIILTRFPQPLQGPVELTHVNNNEYNHVESENDIERDSRIFWDSHQKKTRLENQRNKGLRA